WALRPRLGGTTSHDGTAYVAFGSKDNLRPSDKGISGLNHTPHAAAVYASRPPLLSVSRNTRFQAARYALPGLDFHQLIAPASWRSFAHPTLGYCRWENAVSALVMNSSRHARPSSVCRRARPRASAISPGSSTRSLQP